MLYIVMQTKHRMPVMVQIQLHQLKGNVISSLDRRLSAGTQQSIRVTHAVS
ncbi:hypothetical protein HOLleu_44227 [Holothuria leucospilota]|uniref:Uncharacterized protein n=1 Tax=Holothuria leucospilota TaxID=206669 RepID=A0A9Q0YCP3_HOLLE|nr:hypothetical protein HOLleu_44227 [Holothuria leucospilota]